MLNAKSIRRALGDRRGAIGITMGVTMPVVVGFVALGVETGLWFSTKRAMQTAADSAAIAAAMERAGGGDETDLLTAATGDAALNGLTGGDSIVVNNPPTSGGHTQDDSAVEVLVERTQPPLFSALFLSDPITIHARAVARGDAASNGYPFCFLALDPESADTALLQNNTQLPERCGIAVNSEHEQALRLTNNAHVLGTAKVVGGYVTRNNAGVAHPVTGAAATPDPYLGVDTGEPGVCVPPPCEARANDTVWMTPGRFCNGCDFGNNATVNLAAGTYYIDHQLDITNNVTVNGEGVTFVLKDNAVLNLGNNAHINVTAPTDGPLAGIAFMSEANSPFIDQRLRNNVHLNVTGAFYFPNQRLVVENHTNTPGGCTQFIAMQLKFTNNADLDNQCEDTGVKPIGANTQVAVRLVE